LTFVFNKVIIRRKSESTIGILRVSPVYHLSLHGRVLDDNFTILNTLLQQTTNKKVI